MTNPLTQGIRRRQETASWPSTITCRQVCMPSPPGTSNDFLVNGPGFNELLYPCCTLFPIIVKLLFIVSSFWRKTTIQMIEENVMRFSRLNDVRQQRKFSSRDMWLCTCTYMKKLCKQRLLSSRFHLLLCITLTELTILKFYSSKLSQTNTCAPFHYISWCHAQVTGLNFPVFFLRF